MSLRRFVARGASLICPLYEATQILWLQTVLEVETQDGAVRAGKTDTQDGSPLSQGGSNASTSFSQNPKQVLVASDFWCDSSGVSRRQYHPLSLERY